MLGEFRSLYDLMNAFPSDYHCEQHLEKIRWNGYVVSPFDETLVNILALKLVRCSITLKSLFKNGLSLFGW